MTGETDPVQRSRMWRRAKFIFATPQTVLNDVKTGRIDFMDVVLLIFDEAHRSIKDYCYTELARAYKDRASAPLILGLTASPGGTRQRVQEIKKNLFIENVQARAEEDTDVKPYVVSTSLEIIKVSLPGEYHTVLNSLRAVCNEKIARLVEAGFLSTEVRPTKTTLLRARGPMVSRLKASSEVDRERISRLLVDQAHALVILHGIELLETQGILVLLRYLQRLRDEPGPATSALIRDGRWRSIERETGKLAGAGYPKLESLTRVLTDQFATKKDSRAIVFTQYRDTIDTIIERLKASNIRAVRFVGQTNRAGNEGLQQKQQTEILERFRAGKSQVLVSSSIGEEGLHVPDVDLVVFFEAVPSEIRSIQRKGRTGRTRPGRVVILLAEGTIDEAYYRSSLNRERSMRDLVFGRGLKQENRQPVIDARFAN